MKKATNGFINPALEGFSIFILLLVLSTGCRKHVPPVLLSGYQKTVLVANVAGYDAARIDPTLVNAWGIAAAPSGPIWIASNHTSVTQVYDKNGNTLIPAVSVLAGEGAPTGVVFNGTTNFVIPANGKPGRFIFAGEDGTISAWNGGTSTIKVADQSSAEAVYKGLAMGSVGADTFLYASNFKGSKIDVFDKNYNLVNDKPFVDAALPHGYAPFNIRNIGGLLFVTYAKQKGPENMDDEKGPGNGYINIFDTKGMLLRRFASRGALNSPWGIVQATTDFIAGGNAILVGNFGDGRINVYAPDGEYLGHLNSNGGHAIEIDGLWALENNIPGTDPKQLFFTAGPAEESHGLFGYLQKN